MGMLCLNITLPTGGFRVLSDTEVEALDLDSLGDESDDGLYTK